MANDAQQSPTQIRCVPFHAPNIQMHPSVAIFLSSAVFDSLPNQLIVVHTAGYQTRQMAGSRQVWLSSDQGPTFDQRPGASISPQVVSGFTAVAGQNITVFAMPQSRLGVQFSGSDFLITPAKF